MIRRASKSICRSGNQRSNFPSTRPRKAGRGISAPEIGADDLQMIAGKDFALIGVELFGEAAAGQA